MAVKRPVKRGGLTRFLVLGDHLKTFRGYLREVAYELRKVVWPSRKHTIGTTAIVVVVVMIFSVYLGIVDALLSRLVRLLIG